MNPAVRCAALAALALALAACGTDGPPPENPFKPTRSERELRLKAQVGPELPFEEDITRWFPLWEIPL